LGGGFKGREQIKEKAAPSLRPAARFKNKKAASLGGFFIESAKPHTISITSY